jgi:hypothetical protein
MTAATPHACIAVFHATLHANNFAEGSHEYLCAMGYLCR